MIYIPEPEANSTLILVSQFVEKTQKFELE